MLEVTSAPIAGLFLGILSRLTSLVIGYPNSFPPSSIHQDMEICLHSRIKLELPPSIFQLPGQLCPLAFHLGIPMFSIQPRRLSVWNPKLPLISHMYMYLKARDAVTVVVCTTSTTTG